MWGRKSIELDLRDPEHRNTFRELASVADVILENQLSGAWTRIGLDLQGLRQSKQSLIVASVTGFGQTGPLAPLPSHGLNMDALGDGLPLRVVDGQQRLAPTHTSWGNELGSLHAALAIVAALLHARATGEGASIDISCWDALVESHRAEIAATIRTGERKNAHDSSMGPLYDVFTAKDGKPVLLGALEEKFFHRFCDEIGRPDLKPHHHGGDIEYGAGDDELRRQLEPIFASVTSEEWQQRFTDWDVPGSRVLQLPEVMDLEHFTARRLVEGEAGEWPNVMLPIRWQHVDERAGAGLAPPAALGADTDAVLEDWLGR
jgi:crotonobetainyl-CoA:carnitine CoA-transferase CaiB-like acyl-CoA transferase